MQANTSTMAAALAAAGIVTTTAQPQAAQPQPEKAKNIRRAQREATERQRASDKRAAAKAATIKARKVAPDTQAAKAEGEKAKARAAARLAEVTPIARDIATAALALEDTAASMQAMILAAYCDGVTFAELEAVELTGKAFPQVPGRGGKPRAMRLTDLTAYRKVKSRILKAVEAGATIEPDMTSGDLTAAAKKPGKAGTGESDAPVETVSVPNAQAAYHFATADDLIGAALKMLQGADAGAYREAHLLAIRAVAKLAANEEAARAAKAEKKSEKQAA